METEKPGMISCFCRLLRRVTKHVPAPSTNSAGTTGYPHTKMNLNPLLLSIYKINSKRIRDINVKAKKKETIKLIEENVDINLVLWKFGLIRESHKWHQSTKWKEENKQTGHYHDLRPLCLEDRNGNLQGAENLATHISDREFLTRICKGPKLTDNPIGKWWDWLYVFPRRMHKILIVRHMKRCSASLATIGYQM